ncbi:MAG: hypothetical protein GYB68_12715 [Chloroflexi bacterium]|nr:hypothetical protein [Chloroflexota bacterium]
MTNKHLEPPDWTDPADMPVSPLRPEAPSNDDSSIASWVWLVWLQVIVAFACVAATGILFVANLNAENSTAFWASLGGLLCLGVPALVIGLWRLWRALVLTPAAAISAAQARQRQRSQDQ